MGVRYIAIRFFLNWKCKPYTSSRRKRREAGKIVLVRHLLRVHPVGVIARTRHVQLPAHVGTVYHVQAAPEKRLVHVGHSRLALNRLGV